MLVLIKIIQLEIRRAIHRRKTQQFLFPKLSIPLIRKTKDPFLPLRKQDPAIRSPVMIIIIDDSPVELARRDPFELFRTSRRFGSVERVWVYPRVLPLRSLPTGHTQHLDGPSSETSPHGTITFHRLRDYVPGDDLRLVHWRSSARAGHLIVRHNVDTSRPYNVVLLDLRRRSYAGELFEEAVDVAASVIGAGLGSSAFGSAAVSSGASAALELRLTDGTVLGGPRVRTSAPLLDHLTAVTARDDGSLQEQLLSLRRARGGTSLVIVTGKLADQDLPYIVALRRSFERLVVVSLDAGYGPQPALHGIRLIVAGDAATAAEAWNAAGTRR